MASRADADWNIVKGLHFRPALSYLITDNTTLFSRKAFPGPIQFATTRLKPRTKTTPAVDDRPDLTVRLYLQADHHFMILGGFNYTRNTGNVIDIGSQRGTNDYITTISEPSVTTVNGVTVTNVTNFGTSLSETKSASFFGQFSYDYQSKYLVSAVVRRDGFSNFAPQTSMLPSVCIVRLEHS